MIKTATDITRTTVDEMRAGAEDLKTKISDLAEDIQQHTGAKVLAPDADKDASQPAPTMKPLSF